MKDEVLTIDHIKQMGEILDRAECKCTMMACPDCGGSGWISEFHIFDRYTGDYYLHNEYSMCYKCMGGGILGE